MVVRCSLSFHDTLHALLLLCLPVTADSLEGRGFQLKYLEFWVRNSEPYLNKETIGSPEFQGYPRKYMIWSQTPVVTLNTFHIAFRSVAFQTLQAVGFHF